MYLSDAPENDKRTSSLSPRLWRLRMRATLCKSASTSLTNCASVPAAPCHMKKERITSYAIVVM